MKKAQKKALARLVSRIYSIIIILAAFYLIGCYIDIVSNNTSKEKADELKSHNYNIIVTEVAKSE